MSSMCTKKSGYQNGNEKRGNEQLFRSYLDKLLADKQNDLILDKNENEWQPELFNKQIS